MTYSEAIEYIRKESHEQPINSDGQDAYIIAIYAMQKLNEYEAKLRELYGECDGMIETVIDSLVKYNKSIGIKTPFKYRLLTDYDVDLWDECKQLGTIKEVREAIEEFQIIKSADEDLEYYIQELKQAKYDIETFWEEPTKLSKAMGMAIKALKENQEYKKIVALEELEQLRETNLTGIELAQLACMLIHLQKYEQLGTLEEVREAVEKQIPKKPKGDYNSVPHYRCPNCNRAVKLYSDSAKGKICRWCGQRIDWG